MTVSRITSAGTVPGADEPSSSQGPSAAVARTRTDLTREHGPLANAPARVRRTQSAPDNLPPRREAVRALLEGHSGRSEMAPASDSSHGWSMSPQMSTMSDGIAPMRVASGAEGSTSAGGAADLARQGLSTAGGLLQGAIRGGKGVASFAWQHLDVRPMVSRADDAEFVAMLREGGDVERAMEPPAASLEALQRSVGDMKARLHGAASGEHAMPPDIARHFDKRLDEIASVLSGLQKDEPLAKRAAIYVSMNMLLPVLPMAVSVGGHENKFVAELSAMYAKTALMAVGSMRSPTAASMDSVKDHFLSRHYISLVQAATFALPTFVKKLNHLNSDMKFGVGAGVATSVAAVHAFFGQQIKDYVNKNWRGALDPGATASLKQLSPETQRVLAEAMTEIKDTAHVGERTLVQAKDEFLAGNKELSPYTSGQVYRAAAAFHRVAKELTDLLAAEGVAGVEGAAGEAETRGTMVARNNEAFVAKMSMMLLATGICVGTTALMAPDTIGVVDNAGDGLFTALLMTKAALDPNINRHDALHEFRGFVGLSLIMLGVLAVDKGLSKALGHGRPDFDFIDKSGPMGAAVAAVAMSILNVAIPGPMGNVLSGGLEKLMNLKPTDLWNALQSVGQNAMNFFAGAGPHEESRPSSVRIEELDEGAQASPA